MNSFYLLFVGLYTWNLTVNDFLNLAKWVKLSPIKTSNIVKVATIDCRRLLFYSANHTDFIHLMTIMINTRSIALKFDTLVSQLIRYSRTCSKYQDYLKKALVLSHKLLQPKIHPIKVEVVRPKILLSPSRIGWIQIVSVYLN